MKNIKNPIMVLIPTAELTALEKAGYAGATPLVKLFMGPLTWLATGIEDGILYGYADLSMGCVEWGGLCAVEELPSLKVGPAYLERDRHWKHVEGTKYLEMESLVGV